MRTGKGYVVTVPELGWDCVIGIFLADSEEEVWELLAENKGCDVEDLDLDDYVIHRENIYEKA